MNARNVCCTLFASLFVLTACADTGPTAIAETDASPVSMSVQTGGDAGIDLGEPPAPDWLVVFRRNAVPAKFEREVEEIGGTVQFTVPEIGFASVAGLDDASAEALAGLRDVMIVEPEEMLELELPTDLEVASAGSIAAAGVASPGDPATSFFFPRQWHHRAIAADQAWAAGELGSSGVTVAILDTGIDYLHLDTQGLVDLSRSASFVPSDDALVGAFFPTRHPVTDLHFHGTHVASTVSSNAVVASGVTSQTTLIGVKVCNVFGSCATSSVLAGIVHAANNGADVANLSLGGGFYRSGSKGFVALINRVFNYARSKGMLLVVSSGNAAWDLDHFTNVFATYCDAPGVACVSATGPTYAPTTSGPWDNVDTPAAYSNFGRSAISVAAPGGTGSSAGGNGGLVWQACSTTSLLVSICQTSPTWVIGITGTSMASPHASGVAAILAQGGHSATALRSQLQRSADDLGQRGTDPYYGKGRVNASTAAGSY